MENNFTQGLFDFLMKQSKIFFENAENHWQALFAKNNPNEQIELMKKWIEALKKQWMEASLTQEQTAYQTYWQTIKAWSMQACDLMMQEWQKHQDQPLKNPQEFYELWLKCCQEVFKQSWQNQDYQTLYQDFMKTAMKFWEKKT